MIKYKLDPGAHTPERAHKTDAGWDLRTPKRVEIFAKDFETIDTGVHVQIPEGCVGYIMSKSGLNMKDDLITTGVIDCGYTGSIRVKLYNLGNKRKVFEKGDKIAQLVIQQIITAGMEQVEELEETERGSNGFGSSGR